MFPKCEIPFNVVPDGYDGEGEPPMGKWYAFVHFEGGCRLGFVRKWQSVLMVNCFKM